MNGERLYQVGRSAVNLYAHTMMQMDVVQTAPLPEGAKILAANHPTTLDPFLITTLLREQTHILITESAFNVPVFGRFLRQTGHIPVIANSGSAAVAAALRLLNEGKTLAIFPEGALSPLDTGLGKAHTGVARLALSTGAPVIPVGIALEHAHIRYKATTIKGVEEVVRWYRGGRYVMTVGAPQEFSGDVEDRAHVNVVLTQIMQSIRRLSHLSAYRLGAPVTAATAFDTLELPSVS